jgi:hypothetical protein
VENVKTNEKFTIINRDDGKTIIASTEVYEHIGTHSSLGKGSVFSGGITRDMINSFLASASIPTEEIARLNANPVSLKQLATKIRTS